MTDIRSKRILSPVNLESGIGLEIGPLTAPVVEKGRYDIYYLDHMSTEDLKNKYKDEPVDLSRILPVDFVVTDNSIKAAVGSKRFDYVIASHVIEHIPDIVSWLEDIASILKPGGILSLAIPDKRFTFDIERRDSEASEIIGAHIDKLEKPSSSSMYDYASHYVEDVDSGKAWNDPGFFQNDTMSHRWTKTEALAMAIENLDNDKYIDCHCYVFTPSSFAAILRELSELGLIKLKVANFLETQQGELEFYVALQKIDPKKTGRKSLFNKIPAVNSMNTNVLHEERIRELEDEVSRLTNSLSWKVTKPLRRVKKIISDRK